MSDEPISDFNTIRDLFGEQQGFLDPQQSELAYAVQVMRDQGAPRNLPDVFWQTRWRLEQIRTSAHTAMRSPDAVLGFSLARVIASTPPGLQLPAIAGATASLNMFVMIPAPSGVGKSTSKALSDRLIHGRIDRDGLSFGSGEGLIESYMGSIEVPVEPGSNKTREERRQVHESALFAVDEGETLFQQGSRSGSILIPTLRSAWSGQALGQSNASSERWRHLDKHRYRMAAVVSIQPQKCGPLFADAAGGLPQRFLFFAATDPAMVKLPNKPIGAIDWEAQPPIPAESETVTMIVDAAIESHIRDIELAKNTGALVVPELDSHRYLVTLKAAAALALFEGRTNINGEDWALAEMIWFTSCAVRDRALDDLKRQRRADEKDAQDRKERLQEVLSTADERHRIQRLAENVTLHLRAEGAQTRGAIRRKLHSGDRMEVDHILDWAVAKGLIRLGIDGENYEAVDG